MLFKQDLINAGWQGDEIKQSKFPVLERADILGCYDGETLVSQFAVYPLNMNIYNEIYSIGFHLSRIFRERYYVKTDEEKPDTHESKKAIIGTAIPVFHSAI